MTYFIQMIVILVRLLLGALQIAFLIRAVFSMLMPMQDNAFTRFLQMVTEPVVIPFRLLLERFSFVRNCPIDIAYSVAFLTLILMETALPAVRLS